MQAHSDLWRLWVFFGMLGLMLLMESVIPARPWHDSRWKRLGFHGVITVLNQILMRLIFVPPLLLLASTVHERGWGLGPALGVKGWVDVAATLVLFDFFDYWMHRWHHRVPLLWRVHRTHHYDTHVDVSTTLRFHILEFASSTVFKASWILIWGPSLFAFAVFEAAITFYAMFHHSNIRLGSLERFVRWVHMTPHLHAGHHTATLRTRDNNYSTIFLWWDRLFGTLVEPNDEELKTLGLPEGRHSDLSLKWFWASPVRMGP